MDYRCPSCAKDLGGRKRLGAIIARMEIDCPHCRSRIQLNVHPLEMKVVLGGFAAFAVLAALGYFFHSNFLIFLALIAGMAGPMGQPAIEQTLLKNWARFAPVAPKADSGRS